MTAKTAKTKKTTKKRKWRGGHGQVLMLMNAIDDARLDKRFVAVFTQSLTRDHIKRLYEPSPFSDYLIVVSCYQGITAKGFVSELARELQLPLARGALAESLHRVSAELARRRIVVAVDGAHFLPAKAFDYLVYTWNGAGGLGIVLIGTEELGPMLEVTRVQSRLLRTVRREGEQ